MLHRRADEVVAEIEERLERLERKSDELLISSNRAGYWSQSFTFTAFGFGMLAIAISVGYAEGGRTFFVWVMAVGAAFMELLALRAALSAVRTRSSDQEPPSN